MNQKHRQYQNKDDLATYDLWQIEQIINDGDKKIAIEMLQNGHFEGDDDQEKEFLLGYANRLLENPKQALFHFTNAIFTNQAHLPATEEGLLLLMKHGYCREAKYILKYIEKLASNSELSFGMGAEKIFSIGKQSQEKIIIAIHQPAYLPWLGYIHKIFYSDKFIVHDSVEYSKKSFIKRTLIRQGRTNDSTYLTIPSKKHSDFCPINEMLADNTQEWREKHINKIKAAYSKTPYFSLIYPKISQAFEQTSEMSYLVEISMTLLQAILDILEIKTPLYYSSHLLTESNQETAHAKNMKMCQMLQGDIYFSGTGARDYQDGKSIPEGMSLVYQNIWNYLDANPYIEENLFVNGLSTLDALFLAGPEKIIDLFNEYDNPSNNLIFS